MIAVVTTGGHIVFYNIVVLTEVKKNPAISITYNGRSDDVSIYQIRL